MSSERPGHEPVEDAQDATRDASPDPRSPIDERAPVSGHSAPPERPTSAVEAPEHDWGAARERIFPLLAPVGTAGVPADWVRDPTALGGAGPHTQPVVSSGPAGLVVLYGMRADGFDVLINGDHLLSWGVGSEQLQAVALGNLAAWSERTGWTEESSGTRRLLSSDSGEGYDAARILLPAVRAYLSSELAGDGAPPGARVLVGLPERDLLVAGSLAPDDAEFVALFGDFVVELSGASDNPIDRRVFELSGGELVEFAP